MLTEAELLELERLEREATAGPWSGFVTGILQSAHWVVANDPDSAGAIMSKPDAALIAAMRNALPSLLAAYRERDELRRQVDALQNAGRRAITNWKANMYGGGQTVHGDNAIGWLEAAIAATERKGEP